MPDFGNDYQPLLIINRTSSLTGLSWDRDFQAYNEFTHRIRAAPKCRLATA